ncbi:MAG: hypothetical protein GEU91_24220 [Rhizobiales bacterium]|nr:hypothetical protein [Hyphomicrobiales bacterium]
MRTRLFLPSARQINWLLIVGFLTLGYALYLRYLVVEQPAVGLACEGGLQTWLCATRRLAIILFTHSVFGWLALAAGVLNLIRPQLVLFAIGVAAAGFGIVLYNVALSAVAVALLILSLARPVPVEE